MTLTANRRNSGRMSSWKSCRAAAAWSLTRRLNAISTPGMTSSADHTSPWKIRCPTSESWAKSNSGTPKTNAR